MTSTTGSPPRHRNALLVGRMRAALVDAAGAGLSSMSSEELGDYLADLEGLVAQAKAEVLSAVREADRREIAKATGAASTAAWLSSTLRIRPEEAGRAVKLARDLDTQLPATCAALQAGEISAEHADVIARALRRLRPWVGLGERVEAERLLLVQAGTFDPKDLAGLGRTVLHTIDADLADRELARQLEADEARAEREREITLFDDPYSVSTFLRGKLDPVTNEMFRVAVEPLSKPRPTDADGPDLRSHAQRMGDGFHELLRRFLASGAAPTHAGEKPHIVITIDPTKLRNGTGTGQLLHTGASISARTVQQIACDAEISVYHPGTGNPDRSGGKEDRGGKTEGGRNGTGKSNSNNNGNGGSDGNRGEGIDRARLSEGVRLYAGRVRRMLDLRDRGCAFPGCNRPPSWCQAHHIVPWSKGGSTTIYNGVLLCGYHHRHLHQGTWQIRTAHDGHPEFIPPIWIDKNRTPIRNHRIRN